MSARRRDEREQRFDFALGQAIMRARKRLGLSVAEVANSLDIGHRSIYRIEAGDRCSFFLVVEIAKRLRISLSELVPDLALFSSQLSCSEKNQRIVPRRNDCALG